MRLSNLLHLYRIRLRKRLVQELLALTGIAVGVALVFAALVANASLEGSVSHLTRGVTGDMPWQVVARGAQGIDARMVDAIRRQPAVRHAASVVEARAVLRGPQGERAVVLFGGDRALARHGGPLLRSFSEAELEDRLALALPAPIAADLGVRFGSKVTIVTSRGAVSTTVGAQLHEGDIGELVRSPVAIAPLPYAQRLAAMRGRVSRILVAPQPGRDAEAVAALRRIAGDGANVLPSDADVDLFAQAALPTRQSTALFSFLAAAVGLLFAMSAVLLTVPQRRRFIIDMRFAGHPPATVAQVVLTDGLALGVAASALGLVIGDQLSRHLFDDVPGYLSFAWPLGDQRVVTWPIVAVSVAAGVLAGCVAVVAPLREVLTRDLATVGAPTAPTSRARRLSWAAVGGGTCLAGTVAILLLAPEAAVLGIALLTASLLLLLPSALGLAVGVLSWFGQWVRSPSPAIAIMELRSRAARTRTLALAATGAAAVFGSVAIGGAHRDLLDGLTASASDIDRNADLWASFPGAPNAFATTPIALSPATVDAVERVPGVEEVRWYRGAFLDVAGRRVWVLAPPAGAPQPMPVSQLGDTPVEPVERALRVGGAIVLSRQLAEDLDVDAGETVRLASPRPLELTVAAVSTNLGWPPGAMVLNGEDFARGWRSSWPTALHIDVAPGASMAAVKAGVRQALGSAMPLTLETTAERERRHHESARQGLSRLTEIKLLVLVAAILAMAAAMGGVLWQRRVILAGLKVDGFTEAELWRAILLEISLLLGVACVTGAAFGFLGQVLLGRALRTVTGFPVFYEPAVPAAIVVLALVGAITAGMLAVAGFLAVRVKPAPEVTV